MKKATIILIAILIVFGTFYFCFKKNTADPHKLNLHRVVRSAEFSQWIVFSPENEHFSASFPKKPKINCRDLPIPGSSNSLPYKEFICEMENGVLFSISYTILPSEWLRYGKSLVLGGALKVIMRELGKTELVGKDSTTFKSFPALDYEHYTVSKEAQREAAGTLVLVGSTLYKIEVTYPLEMHSQVQDRLANFIENFTPEKAEVISSQPENSVPDKSQRPR